MGRNLRVGLGRAQPVRDPRPRRGMFADSVGASEDRCSTSVAGPGSSQRPWFVTRQGRRRLGDRRRRHLAGDAGDVGRQDPSRRPTAVSPTGRSRSDRIGRHRRRQLRGSAERGHVHPWAPRTEDAERADPLRAARSLFAIGINAEHSRPWGSAGLAEELDAGTIRELEPRVVQMYLPESEHYGETAVVAVFRRSG